MNLKQILSKAFYPLLMRISGLIGRRQFSRNENNLKPLKSFYSHRINLIGGGILNFEELKGKKVVIVNTASSCGYTAQYDALQKLYSENTNIVVIAFPANDFGDQEKGSDSEIAAFCTTAFQIKFPVAEKSTVKKSEEQHPVFSWLTDKDKNGWNEKQPAWNFAKYIVDESGMLAYYFDPGYDPLGKEFRKALGI